MMYCIVNKYYIYKSKKALLLAAVCFHHKTAKTKRKVNCYKSELCLLSVSFCQKWI